MLSEQTWQQIRSLMTELDEEGVEDTWRECEGWLIYGQRTSVGLLRVELYPTRQQLQSISTAFAVARSTSTVPDSQQILIVAHCIAIHLREVLGSVRSQECHRFLSRESILSSRQPNQELTDDLSQRPSQPLRCRDDSLPRVQRAGHQNCPCAVIHLMGSVAITIIIRLNLMGFYAMLAFNANAVDLRLPQEITEPPLPV
jgi:hypothetical protein